MRLTRLPLRGPAGQRGVTLVELLVALLLGLGVAATVGWFQRAQFLAMEDQATQLDLQGTARAIIDVFARDVRRAGMDPRCAKAVQALVEATPTTLRLQADLNANGTLEAASEDLRYRLVEGGVERTSGSATEPLIENVESSGSRLRYFDAAGTELIGSGGLSAAQLTLVRRVRLELALRTPARRSPESPPLAATVATDVELRNRFFIAASGCS